MVNFVFGPISDHSQHFFLPNKSEISFPQAHFQPGHKTCVPYENLGTRFPEKRKANIRETVGERAKGERLGTEGKVGEWRVIPRF